MTTVCFVSDRETQRFSDGDFPLAVGLNESGSLVFGPNAESAPLLWLLSHQGRFAVQQETTRKPVLLNGKILDQPAWLCDGDTIALDTFEICISAQNGDVLLQLRGTFADIGASASLGPFNQRGRSEHCSGPETSGSGFGSSRSFTARRIALALFVLLSLGIGYVLVASPVRIAVVPEPESIDLSGFIPPIPIFDRYLALPGSYLVKMNKSGFRPLEREISVKLGSSPSFEFTLEKLPGQLSVTTPPVDGAAIFIDDVRMGDSPLHDITVEAGQRTVRVVAERYLPAVQSVDIRGMGELQSLSVKLLPAWGTLSVDSVPTQVRVTMDGTMIGETPLVLEPLQGKHELVFTKEGWKAQTHRVDIQAGHATTLPTVHLEKIDGTLALRSDPPGALITLDGKFFGRTPASLPLPPDKKFSVKLSKQGYEDFTREIRIDAGNAATVVATLQPEYGTLYLSTTPPGATLKLDGRPAGNATQRLRLQTVPHVLEIAKPGYEPYVVRIAPRAGISKKIDIALKTRGEALKEKAKKGIMTAAGQTLRLIYIQSPVKFMIGASRREPGRRSNENEVVVELTRSFLVSDKEVTNQEFRKFFPQHNSGNYQGLSLDGPDQPAVNVTWEDAVRYANWLSMKEGLAPAYKEVDGKIVPVSPLTNGYRLPTEVEWEFVSRYDGGQEPLDRPLRFPWGDKLPPADNAGNYADDTAQGLPFAIPGYKDGFSVSAPVGKFSPNRSMVYDLGGNVSEWCHDFYDVRGVDARQPLRDPFGPAEGRFHVIKGASWRSGSISELRLSARDYSGKTRDDVGFRIARYAAQIEK